MNSEIRASLNKLLKETAETVTWLRLSQNVITKGEYAAKLKIIENNLDNIKEIINK